LRDCVGQRAHFDPATLEAGIGPGDRTDVRHRLLRE
jgi:hypothetical protein